MKAFNSSKIYFRLMWLSMWVAAASQLQPNRLYTDIFGTLGMLFSAIGLTVGLVNLRTVRLMSLRNTKK